MKKNLFVVSAYILAIAMIANNLSPLNVFAKQSDETCTTCSISDNSNDNGENIEDYNIEDYIEQYKQYDNEEESNIVQAVLNSSYYSEIENIITSNPNIYKTNVSDDVVYTLSYQLENGTVVFTLNKEFVITNAITNIFDEQTNYSVVNNLVNKETNYYYFDAVPYAADCKTYVCDQYEVIGGSTEPLCAFLVGMACAALAPAGMPGYVICYAGTVIVCNNPAGMRCAKGKWYPVCPL
jgi:hypothetical protein